MRYNRNNEITDCRLMAINLFFYYNRKRQDLEAMREVMCRLPPELIPVYSLESEPYPASFYLPRSRHEVDDRY